MTRITKQAFDNFYKNKTIMRSYQFEVLVDSLYKVINNSYYPRFKSYTSSFLHNLPADGFTLNSNLVKSINIPEFTFSKEGVKYGPTQKSTPTMSFDGYEIQLELEEDDKGTVKQFIEHCKSRNVNADGIFWPTNFAELPSLKVRVLDGSVTGTDLSRAILEVEFSDLIFLSSSEASFNYSEASAISYTVTFSTANMQTTYISR